MTILECTVRNLIFMVVSMLVSNGNDEKEVLLVLLKNVAKMLQQHHDRDAIIDAVADTLSAPTFPPI